MSPADAAFLAVLVTAALFFLGAVVGWTECGALRRAGSRLEARVNTQYQWKGAIDFKPRSIWTDHRDVRRREKLPMKPVSVGAAKCERKEHRPLNGDWRCSRCGAEMPAKIRACSWGRSD